MAVGALAGFSYSPHPLFILFWFIARANTVVRMAYEGVPVVLFGDIYWFTHSLFFLRDGFGHWLSHPYDLDCISIYTC